MSKRNRNRNPWSHAAAPAAKEVSAPQLAANRANAQLSSGPLSPAGKAKSSMNAVKTGLTGHTVLLPTDDVNEYAAFIAGYRHDFSPVGQAESELVHAIADADWRLRRVRALEFAIYAKGHADFEELFTEYAEEVRYSLIQLHTHTTYEKDFRNLHLQENRLHRRREKDMAELRRLKNDRRETQSEPEDFSDVDALAPPLSIAPQIPAQSPFTDNGFDYSTSLEPSVSDR